MSGLTGYLTANGTDLSYVFMPINAVLVGSVSLSSNNDFTGTNKFSAGIVGPTVGITYTSDMIGYTIKKNGTVSTIDIPQNGLLTGLHASDTNGVALTAGVWMITLYAFFQPTNAATSVFYMTSGLSTDGITPYTYVGGTGEILVGGSTYMIASANSRAIGSVCIPLVVPTGGGTYYQLVNIRHNTTMNCLGTLCFFNATRIA